MYTDGGCYSSEKCGSKGIPKADSPAANFCSVSFEPPFYHSFSSVSRKRLLFFNYLKPYGTTRPMALPRNLFQLIIPTDHDGRRHSHSACFCNRSGEVACLGRVSAPYLCAFVPFMPELPARQKSPCSVFLQFEMALTLLNKDAVVTAAQLFRFDDGKIFDSRHVTFEPELSIASRRSRLKSSACQSIELKSE